MKRMSVEVILSIVTVAVLLGVFGFLGFYWWQKREAVDGGRAKVFEEASVGAEIPRGDERDVVKVAEKFVSYYQDALADGNEKDVKRARELLTERAQSVVDLTVNPVDGLRKFTLGLDAPNSVRILDTVRQSENFAETTSQWVYDDETLSRYFYFVKEGEDAEWRLDSIQLMQQ